MEELVRYIVTNLVKKPDEVEITTTNESEKVALITVKVAKDDIGKVIGRNGKIAVALRAIVKSASEDSGKRYKLKIGERD